MNIRKYILYSSQLNVRLRTTLYSTTSASSLSTIGEPFGSGGSRLKGLFGGSGSDLMNDPRPIQRILAMVDKPVEDVHVLYMGTATYDIQAFESRQTDRFRELNCKISALKVALDDSVPLADAEDLIDQADVLVVGGGNTLYALDRWTNLGLVPALRKAMERGAVISGGSAGAICWFDGGHSNSMDPDTYKVTRLSKFAGSSSTAKDESSVASSDDVKDWKYIRVPALGFLPGLLCPHHDRVQSNGILRAVDFDRMLLRSPDELGIAIDHWAALVVDGDSYEVLSLEGKPGSLPADGGGEFVSDGAGIPGIWIKEVVDGKVQQRPCPPKGATSDLLRECTGKMINDEEALRICREENPPPRK